MIQWEKRVDGRKLEQFLALMPGVQESLTETRFRMQVAAEKELAQVRSNSKTRGGSVGEHASIEVHHEHVDHYLILKDVSTSSVKGAPNSALAIELGRSAYEVTLERDGQDPYRYTVGAMKGTFILHHATGLPETRKGGSGGRRHITITQGRRRGRGRGRSARRDKG